MILPPNAIMPEFWARQAQMLPLPAEPGIVVQHAYFIEALGSWIAEDVEDEDYLRWVLGPEARILLGSVLKDGGERCVSAKAAGGNP